MYIYYIGGTGKIRVGPEAPGRGQGGLRLFLRDDGRLIYIYINIYTHIYTYIYTYIYVYICVYINT